jgi:hypothetical protein
LLLLGTVQNVNGEEEAKPASTTPESSEDKESENKPAPRSPELTDETFNKMIVEEGPLFVKFYLPTYVQGCLDPPPTHLA